MWPLFILLHLSGLERFAWPSKVAALEMALTALLGTVLSNMLLARAMLLASPVVATVGLSLSIPFAMASDALRGRGRFSPVELPAPPACGPALAASPPPRRCKSGCARYARRRRAATPTLPSWRQWVKIAQNTVSLYRFSRTAETSVHGIISCNRGPRASPARC